MLIPFINSVPKDLDNPFGVKRFHDFLITFCYYYTCLPSLLLKEETDKNKV